MTSLIPASGAIKAVIRLATAVIPMKAARKRTRQRLLAWLRAKELSRLVPLVRKRYEGHVEACRAKLAAGERLRVCFLVCDAAMFSAEPVYQSMLGDKRFAPFVAVVPRVTRGEKFMRETLEKTLSVLSSRYRDVRSLYDPDAKSSRSLEGEADVVFTSIVYDEQTLEQYTALPLSRFALVACIPYGYGGQLLSDIRRTIFLPQFALFWRLFVANQCTLSLWKEANPQLADALVVGGYPKMDRLAATARRAARPKTILICPHHTLEKDGTGLALSNFLQYAEFFLELPKEFPDVHFVFRPHPLLFPRLATSAWWGEKRTAAYRCAMSALPNVEFQQGGDYFDVFVNSDAMIHDCGSFLAEYFYTGHPQCYILRDGSTLDREFTPFGKRLQDHVDHAFTSEDIRDFVRKVASGAADGREQERRDFAEREVCMYHPHASERVLEEIMRSLA